MPNKESWNRHKQPDGYVHSESKVPVKSFPHGFRYTVKVIRIPFWLILFLFGLVARTSLVRSEPQALKKLSWVLIIGRNFLHGTDLKLTREPLTRFCRARCVARYVAAMAG
jgi:hypothetical protein